MTGLDQAHMHRDEQQATAEQSHGNTGNTRRSFHLTKTSSDEGVKIINLSVARYVDQSPQPDRQFALT